MAKSKKPSKAKTESSASSEAPAASEAASAIDPAQSAALAAAMVGKKIMPPSASAAGGKTESSSFKNLKDSLSKPHNQTIGSLLDKTGGVSQKKSGAPLGGPQQLRHNQTFGADINRKSVPRRTGG